MAKQEAPIVYLKRFIPEASAERVLEYLHIHHVHLTITKGRKSILGDYRHATNYKNHRISINGDLNPFSFLITLVHELAHLVTFVKYGNKVAAHGKEWKDTYARMLVDFLVPGIFPQDILIALKKSLPNLPASSCADDDLMRVLKRYDKGNDLVMVEQVNEGALFQLDSGMLFKKGKKLRKRYQCMEVNSGKMYLFSPIYEVKLVS